MQQLLNALLDVFIRSWPLKRVGNLCEEATWFHSRCRPHLLASILVSGMLPLLHLSSRSRWKMLQQRRLAVSRTFTTTTFVFLASTMLIDAQAWLSANLMNMSVSWKKRIIMSLRLGNRKRSNTKGTCESGERNWIFWRSLRHCLQDLLAFLRIRFVWSGKMRSACPAVCVYVRARWSNTLVSGYCLKISLQIGY